MTTLSPPRLYQMCGNILYDNNEINISTEFAKDFALYKGTHNNGTAKAGKPHYPHNRKNLLSPSTAAPVSLPVAAPPTLVQTVHMEFARRSRNCRTLTHYSMYSSDKLLCDK